jgi:hypothetical protein
MAALFRQRRPPFKLRDKYNELEEAPENGYRKQLEIIPSQKKSVFFYCRIGEYYGKGPALPAGSIRKLRDVPYVRTSVVSYNTVNGNNPRFLTLTPTLSHRERELKEVAINGRSKDIDLTPISKWYPSTP